MFQRFFDDGLAHASYLIACDRTREAVVVDPRRDVDVYTTAAAERGLKIVCAIETHVHADFVSGARELAAQGARILVGPDANLQFAHHEARHGNHIAIGDVTLDFLHTPGHTPEHITVLVAEPNQPIRALTGDTLFVGAVGRPDLLGADQARALAVQLHDSLYRILMSLDDTVEVHPAHGAGSLCGAGIGKAPHSTIGQERRFNPLLQQQSADEFVAAVLGDLPETPPYFPRMKRVNRDGPQVLGFATRVLTPRAISPADAATLVEDGAVLIDLRAGDTFAEGHPTGAVSIGFGSKVGYWAGWVVPPGARLLVMAGDARQALEATRQLLRVGFDDVAGYVDGGYEAWTRAGCPTARLERITASDLRDRLARREPFTILDVRSPREWQAGHLNDAISMPVGDVPARAAELSKPGTVATICGSGYRSTLASSLLERAGVDNVVNVAGGMAAYRALESAP
jgi:hydroxyacylglutathione hydrolase